MGPILGTTANIIGLIFVAFTTVFFLFPPEQPVTGNNMNYACGKRQLHVPRDKLNQAFIFIVVFGVVIIMATVTWFTNARSEYESPEGAEALAGKPFEPTSQSATAGSNETVDPKNEAQDTTIPVDGTN